MILRRIAVGNFTSFCYGAALELERGLTLILGPSGCGKTNVARAFKFAVFGLSDTPKNRLINFEHRQKCLKKGENSFCQVEVTLQHKGKELHAQRKLSLARDEIMESANVDEEIDEIITSENFKHIYLRPEFGEDKDDLPSGLRMTHTVIKHLQRNVESGLKMVILDGVFGCLSNASAENLFSHMREMDLDQTIILESWMKPALEDHVTIHNLKFNREEMSSFFATE